MDRSDRRLAGAGAMSLVLGILTVVFGLTVGVLGIVNGGRLLKQVK